MNRHDYKQPHSISKDHTPAVINLFNTMLMVISHIIHGGFDGNECMNDQQSGAQIM